MALPSVTINRLSGGIGRQAAGVDYYSGYLHYFPTGYTLPTGFLTNAIRVCNSITDLEALGVDGLSGDETKASAVQTATAGTAGDTVTYKFTSPINGTVTTLGTAVVPASPTALLTATAIVASINANTYLTGFSATLGALGVFTIIPKVSLGASINTINTLTSIVTGTVTSPAVQFTGGIGSQFDVLYYHVKEAFRMQGILNGKPQGQIWLPQDLRR